MRKLKMLAIPAGLALSMVVAAADTQSAQNLSGTWNLNVAKSTWGKKPKPQSCVVKVEHNEPSLKYMGEVTASSGEPNTAFEFDGAIDGKEYPVKTPSGDGTRVIRRVDAYTTVSETKSKDGRFFQTARTALSKDGKVLTRQLQVKGPTGDVKWTEVYERVQSP